MFLTEPAQPSGRQHAERARVCKEFVTRKKTRDNQNKTSFFLSRKYDGFRGNSAVLQTLPFVTCFGCQCSPEINTMFFCLTTEPGPVFSGSQPWSNALRRFRVGFAALPAKCQGAFLWEGDIPKERKSFSHIL